MLKHLKVDVTVHTLPVSDMLLAVHSAPGSRVQHRRKLSCLPSYLVVRRLTYMQGQTGGQQLLLGNIRRNECVHTESARECPHIAAATAVVLLPCLHQPLPDSTRAATWMYHLCVGVIEVVSWETWFSHPVDKEAEAGTVFFVFRQGTSMCCARASVGYFQGDWSQLTVTVNWSPLTVRGYDCIHKTGLETLHVSLSAT